MSYMWFFFAQLVLIYTVYIHGYFNYLLYINLPLVFLVFFSLSAAVVPDLKEKNRLKCAILL